MKTKDLIKLLTESDPTGERDVILQKDSEGNSYSTLAAIWNGCYVATKPWYGEAYEDDDSMGGTAALFLVPTN